MGAVLAKPGAPTHPNAVVLRAPVNVSPFIRVCAPPVDLGGVQFCRWGALGAGLVWGTFRYRQIKRDHVYVREVEHKEALAKYLHAKRVKAWTDAESMESMAGQMGLPWTPELKAALMGASD